MWRNGVQTFQKSHTFTKKVQLTITIKVTFSQSFRYELPSLTECIAQHKRQAHIICVIVMLP